MNLDEVVTIRVPLTTLLDLPEKARKALDVWRAEAKASAQERVFRLPRRVLVQISQEARGQI